MIRVRGARIAALLAPVALGACVPRQEAPVRPALPPPPPVLPEAPAPAPIAADWQDAPLTEGDWTYRVPSEAIFVGPAGPLLALRCEAGRVRFNRPGAAASMTVATSFRESMLPAALPAGDAMLDELAFSRGRLRVSSADAPDLILPAWPEIGRVIEDCRGQ